jgi:tetratricopeptide (TPR) repeat protein
VAIRRNNLGSACQALGEHQKAIGYYEQALATFKHTLGTEHPSTKTVRNNLSLVKEKMKSE